MAAIDQRIDTIHKELLALAEETKASEAARKKLLEVCQMSLGKVATPTEQVWQMLYQPHVSASIRTNLDLGVFDILNQSEIPLTASQLAQSTGADKLLLVRLLRPLAKVQVVTETAPETYAAGPICIALDKHTLSGGWKFMHDDCNLPCVRLHEFLKETKYQNPASVDEGNFQFSHSVDIPLFPYLQQKPDHQRNFIDMLEGWRLGRTEWFDVYPVQELLFNDFAGTSHNTCNKAAFFVDVGGATGYDIENFKHRLEARGQKMPGQLVLEDLPYVIDDIKQLDEEIVRIKHDFFTTQPVQGAKVYYMRSICHDWSDAKTHEILTQIAKAMEPGYSRLLINDWILPDQNAPLLPCLVDLQMMVIAGGGMERTESQWKALIEGVEGLEIEKFWNIEEAVEGLIECIK